jgi:hypothetical protein
MIILNYIYNMMNDIYYGYIKIKCSNNKCNNVFNISRNNIIKGTEYCCNMGCTFEAYNQSK